MSERKGKTSYNFRTGKQNQQPNEQPDNQSFVSKNKFYGKILDRDTDQWVYFERYLNTMSMRVVRGSLKMADAANQL